MRRLRSVRERARSVVAPLELRKKALLSLSQTLFALAIALAIITIVASYMNYGQGTLMLYVLSAILLIILSYLAYRPIREISFADYVLTMFIAGLADEEKPVGIHGSLLFLGGLFIAVSPLLYTYLSCPCLRHAVGSPLFYVLSILSLGAVLSAIAVVWYVRRILEA